MAAGTPDAAISGAERDHRLMRLHEPAVHGPVDGLPVGGGVVRPHLPHVTDLTDT